MMYQSLVLAVLASTALAVPQHHHKHQHLKRTGSAGLATGTGSPYPYANSTVGPYANSTSTVAITVTSLSTSEAEAVTVTVQPLPVSSGGSTVSAADHIAASDSACAAAAPTTTMTSTEYVTVTVDGDATTASSASSSVAVAPVSSSVVSSSSSVSSATAAEFYATSAAASSAAPSSAAPTTAAPSSSSVPSSSIAASSSAAVTSSSASSTPTASTSSSKRGLAYNDVSLLSMFESKGMSWAYNWGKDAGGSIPSGIEYIPLIWCSTSTSASDWQSTAESAIAAGSSHVLSFNEPDQSTQCNIDASTAASAHIEFMNPLSGKAKIGSPAVTNGGGSTMGLGYLQSFFDACGGKCDIDFAVIHWYSGYNDGIADEFKSHVNDALGVASKNGVNELWITEFALDGASADQTASFLQEVLPWLDSQSNIGRYAFYMCADGLLTSGTSISPQIGAAYVG